VATVVGLAFNAIDESLPEGQRELGITCALIPVPQPGMGIGRRHRPMDAAFMNGPIEGREVFIPMDWVIGGEAQVGQGWRMLMECLAAGRAISLPSSTTGGAKTAVRTTGAYSRIRSQFKVSIGKFEGVEEALARMGGNLYVMESARVITAASVDAGEKPAVISAVVKYHCTERARQVLNDAMDVHGGKGICLGPNNYLGRGYQQIPISITVEGANILTRCLIIFGQGAVRAHPYVLAEIAATQEADAHKASHDFDAALWGHVSFVVSNVARSFWLALTGARLLPVPGAAQTRRYFRNLERLSANFALAGDMSMLFLGGDLKRKESLSGRLGDVMSQLYLATCVLKRWHDDGCQASDLPFVEWAVQDAQLRAQDAMYGLLRNFPVRPAAWLLRLLTFPWGRRFAAPSDQLGHRVARLMMEDSPARDRLTAGMFIWKYESDAVGRLEIALSLVQAAEQVEAKLRAASKGAPVTEHTPEARIAAAVRSGVISAGEGETLSRYYALRRACIMVDDFPHDVGRRVSAQPAQPAVLEPVLARKTA
jgi:acyl-CoA dehydrogenase